MHFLRLGGFRGVAALANKQTNKLYTHVAKSKVAAYITKSKTTNPDSQRISRANQPERGTASRPQDKFDILFVIP